MPNKKKKIRALYSEHSKERLFYLVTILRDQWDSKRTRRSLQRETPKHGIFASEKNLLGFLRILHNDSLWNTE